MKTLSRWTLAIALFVVLTASYALARGGGHGPSGGGGFNRGGGGEFHGGGERNWSGGQHQFNGESGERGREGLENRSAFEGNREREFNRESPSDRLNTLENHLGIQNREGDLAGRRDQLENRADNHYKPFSPEWYAHHPNAWANRHPWAADAWAAATFGAATAWLGWGDAAPVAYGDSGYASSDDASDDDTADASENSNASQLAAAGAGEVSDDAQWLPLGVFAIGPPNQADASHLVQLAVSKDGILRGTYFDKLSDQTQTIQGAIDKTTQRAAWTIGDSSKIVFQTSLKDLTDASGKVSVEFENGQPKLWTLARQKAPDDVAATP